MRRRFRLKGTADFKRVRHLGRSYAHPLIVLVILPNGLQLSRFAVSAGRSLGNAVDRNRAKRIIRSALCAYLEQIKPGWDVIALARRSLKNMKFTDVYKAVGCLLNDALLIDGNENRT